MNVSAHKNICKSDCSYFGYVACAQPKQTCCQLLANDLINDKAVAAAVEEVKIDTSSTATHTSCEASCQCYGTCVWSEVRKTCVSVERCRAKVNIQQCARLMANSVSKIEL